MSDREPLSEDKLAEYTAWAAHLGDEGLPVTGEMVNALLAEVARLRGELRSLGQDAPNALEAQS